MSPSDFDERQKTESRIQQIAMTNRCFQSETKIAKAAGVMLVLLPGIWIGLIVGLSFLETPLKFQAKGMSRELALGVGRLVFIALNISEIVLSLILVTSCWVVRRAFSRRRHLMAPAILVLIVFVQTFYLLPELRVRTDAIVAGATLEPSPLHWIYGVVEFAKLPILLLIFAFALNLERSRAKLRAGSKDFGDEQ